MLSMVKIAILIANFTNLALTNLQQIKTHPVQNKWELHAKNKICILCSF